MVYLHKQNKVVETPRIIQCSIKHRKSIAGLPTFVLALISDILGERYPVLMYTNRALFKLTLQGQLEIYEGQRILTLMQLHDLEKEIANENSF